MTKLCLRTRIKQVSCAILLVCLLLSATSCNSTTTTPKKGVSKTSFLLNTVVSITLYDSDDESIIDRAFDKCKEYESIFSRTDEQSELYKLNHKTLPKEGEAYQVSEELAKLLADGYYYSELSNGAFDITIEPISSLWDFTTPGAAIPSKEAISERLDDISYKKLRLEGQSVTFEHNDMGIDLGAIAKGYIADRLKEYLLSQGVKSAMINLGGNVLCVGEKPNGEPFKIGIQKPFADRNETVAVMNLKDKSVVSSGIYERYIKDGDKLYHHILNPTTGYSYDNDLIAVTIISDKSVDGDGLSTSVFALGLEKGMELINSLDNIHAVFITDDYEMHYSEGFSDAISME